MEHPLRRNRQLIGVTLTSPGSALQFPDGTIELLIRDKFIDNRDYDRIIAVRKARQPFGWLTLVNPRRRQVWSPPREVGATKNTAGTFVYLMHGLVWFGMQRSDFHEFYFHAEDADKRVNRERIHGKWILRLLPGKRYARLPDLFWQFWRPEERGQAPYILTHYRQFDEKVKEWKRRKIIVVANTKLVTDETWQRHFKEALDLGLKAARISDVKEAVELWAEFERPKDWKPPRGLLVF